MTFFGYFFSRNSIKHNFFDDFFKNTYKNILQLDLNRYDLMIELKKLKSGNNVDNNYQKSIDNIINNISSYYSIQNNIIWLLKYTQNSPLFTSIIIFITFCFTTLLIETGQISNVALYKIELTNQQILQNYNATKGRYGL